MKGAFVLLITIGFAAPAAAEPTLSDMLAQASSCSDASLQDFASRTCDATETIAARAVTTCQDKWNAVASKAMGIAPGETVPATRKGALKIYSDAMENEYVRVAELKAIDMRRTSGRCGFD